MIGRPALQNGHLTARGGCVLTKDSHSNRVCQWAENKEFTRQCLSPETVAFDDFHLIGGRELRVFTLW